MYQCHPNSHKLPSSRVVVLAVALLFHSASARATHTYQFQQTTAAGNELNGVVLATLELAALPASHEDVIGLTFTPAGQELLGYGATYEGSFDASYRQLIDNGSGLLVASGQTAWLSDSEAVVQHSDDEGFTSRFELIFPYFSGPYSDEGYAYFARYRYTYDPFFGTYDFEMSASDGPGGYWIAVPEPSSFGLLLLASVCLLKTQWSRTTRRPASAVGITACAVMGLCCSLGEASQATLDLTLDAPNIAPQSGFGRSLAIDGNLIVVGADTARPNGSSVEGQAFLYDAKSGDLMRDFTPPTDSVFNDFFGSAVGVVGNKVVITSRGAPNPIGNASNGQAHVFDAASGSLLYSLDDPTPNNSTSFVGDFGASLSVNQSSALIGNPRDGSMGIGVGEAHLYDLRSGSLIRSFHDPSPSEADAFNNADLFGEAVSIFDEQALVGAPGNRIGNSKVGQAHLFDTVTGDLLYTFSDPSPHDNNYFGGTVSLSAEAALIGDPLHSGMTSYAGRAYLFDTSTGNLIQTFENPAPQLGDAFGSSVALNGSTVVISAPAPFGNSEGTGRTYLFSAMSGELLAEIGDPHPTQESTFGNAVALNARQLLIADMRDGVNGQTHLFSLAPSAVLDQESFGPLDRTPAFNSRIGDGGNFDRAQSFVAGKSGMLAEVELYLKRNEQSALPLLLEIREVGVDGFPIDESSTGSILGSIEIPAADVSVDGGWVDVDLSTLGLQIIEGQQLALVLQSEESLGAAVGEYAWFGSREGSYLQGAAFERRFSGGWEFSTGVNASDTPDFYFRTYVTVVPEPTTATLALLALAVLGRQLGRTCRP